MVEEVGMKTEIGNKKGGKNLRVKEKKKKEKPEGVIITPESLHLLLAQKNYPEIFKSLKIVAVDEWHELLGSKRGVQVELAISRLINIHGDLAKDQCSIWGISATIGNLE